MFKIAKIGIEFEFDIPWRIENVMPFAKHYVRQVNMANTDYVVEVDREYYANQIEFKLRATENVNEWLQYFQEFIHSCYKFMVDVNCVWNPFVGTHIHLFLEKDGEPYNQLARWKKLPIFNYVYDKFTRFISDSRKEFRPEVVAHEAKRLSYNHNILRHFDRQYLKDWIRKNLECAWLQYPLFHNGINRPKYAPVIWSLPNIDTWKPHSLEIRAIPNTWFLTATKDDMIEFIQNIETILNARHNHRYNYVESILANNKRLINIARWR